MSIVVATGNNGSPEPAWRPEPPRSAGALHRPPPGTMPAAFDRFIHPKRSAVAGVRAARGPLAAHAAGGPRRSARDRGRPQNRSSIGYAIGRCHRSRSFPPRRPRAGCAWPCECPVLCGWHNGRRAEGGYCDDLPTVPPVHPADCRPVGWGYCVISTPELTGEYTHRCMPEMATSMARPGAWCAQAKPSNVRLSVSIGVVETVKPAR